MINLHQNTSPILQFNESDCDSTHHLWPVSVFGRKKAIAMLVPLPWEEHRELEKLLTMARSRHSAEPDFRFFYNFYVGLFGQSEFDRLMVRAYQPLKKHFQFRQFDLGRFADKAERCRKELLISKHIPKASTEKRFYHKPAFLYS